MDDDELHAALRAAIDGEVPTVPLALTFLEPVAVGVEPLVTAPEVTFHVQLTEPAEAVRRGLNERGTKRVAKAVDLVLTRLSDLGPRHPPLRTRSYDAFAPIYQSAVQSRTTDPWYVWWFFAPDAQRAITVAAIGSHP